MKKILKSTRLELVSADNLILNPNRYNIIQIEECKDGYLVEYADSDSEGGCYTEGRLIERLKEDI